MDASAPLEWLAQNRDTLTWLGGGAATAAGGLWVALRAVLDRDTDQPDKRKPVGPRSSAEAGVAGGRDVRIGGDVTVHHSRLPRGALLLGVLGLALLGVALFTAGNRVDVRNGSYVGGNVSDSRLTVGPSAPGTGSR